MKQRRKFAWAILTLLLSLVAVEGLLRIPARFRHAGDIFRRSDDGFIRFVATASDSQFADPKPSNTFRIFCFGESAVEGSIYNPRSSFAKILREMLQDLSRGSIIEVVNCGAPGTKSDFALESFRQALKFQPDLMVVYSGNNDYPGYQRVNAVNHPFLFQTNRLLSRYSRLFYFADHALDQGKESGLGLALYLFPARVKNYHLFTAQVREEVIEWYRRNIVRMVHEGREHQVPVYLAVPVGNLRDWPPLKSSCLLPEPQCREIDSQLLKARTDLREGRFEEAETRIELALRSQPEHALAHFLAGQLDLYSDPAHASQHFETALDQDDSLTSRTRPAQRQFLRDLARREAVPLLDFQQIFDQASAFRISGFDLLDDYCHPTLDGQALIATELAVAITANYPRLFRPADPHSLWLQRKNYIQRLGVDNNFIALRFQEMAFYLAFNFDDYDLAEQALRRLRQQQQLVPGSTLLWLVEGLVRERQALIGPARAAFETALRQNPDHAARMINLYFQRFLRWQPPYLLVQARPGTSFMPILNDYLLKEKTRFQLDLDHADRVYLFAGNTLIDVSARVLERVAERRRLAPPALLPLFPTADNLGPRISTANLSRENDRFAATGPDPRLIFGPLNLDPRGYAALEVELEVEATPAPGQRLCLYWRGAKPNFLETDKACAEPGLSPTVRVYQVPLADDPDWVSTGTVHGLRLDPGEQGVTFRLKRIQLLPFSPPRE